MTSLSTPTDLNGAIATFQWQWRSQPLTITYETLGAGQPMLLLPAFSTVSTRSEMTAIAQRLAPHYQVTVLDWPGFGDSDRPRLDYQPALYRQFLQDFVMAQFTEPAGVIAAGHAAGYVMALAPENVWSKIVLAAPTWRGPLAVMGAPEGVRNGVRALVRSPLLGQALYGLNTRPDFLKWMYRRHVFVDAAKLTPGYIAQRYQGTQRPGARYAPAAFVTGGLDPVQTRADFLAYFDRVSAPVMVMVAEQAPPSSLSEMEAMAGLPHVQAVRSLGSLGMAEEYGDEIAEIVLPFLQAALT